MSRLALIESNTLSMHFRYLALVYDLFPMISYSRFSPHLVPSKMLSTLLCPSLFLFNNQTQLAAHLAGNGGVFLGTAE